MARVHWGWVPVRTAMAWLQLLLPLQSPSGPQGQESPCPHEVRRCVTHEVSVCEQLPRDRAIAAYLQVPGR